MPLLSRLSFVSICKETTQGTAASTWAGGGTPAVYVPVQDAQGEELPHYFNDDSLVNNAGLVRNVIQGERDSTFTWNGLLYADSFGPLCVAAGFADTFASAASTHTLKVPSGGTQPPTLTIGDFDNVSFRQWTGQMLDTWDWTIDAKGGIKQTVKFVGWTSASTSTPTATWPTASAFMGWQCGVTVGGVAVTRLVSAGVSIKRSSEVIHTLNNTQNPSSSFAGPIEVNYKISAVVDNYIEWNQLINNTQPGIKFTITNSAGSAGGGAAPVITASSNTCAWTKAVISRKGKYMMLDAELTAITNSTDNGPAQFSITNTVLAGFGAY